MKQINFSIYDDTKNSLTGIIENPEFESMVKKAFYRIAYMQLRNLFGANPNHRLFEIFDSPISDKEKKQADRFSCERTWLNHLGFDHQNHFFSKKEEVERPQSYGNQVMPTKTSTFVDRLHSDPRSS